MIVFKKGQPLHTRCSGFFSSKEAWHTRKSMSLSRQNSLINRHICALVGRSAKDILAYLNKLMSDSKMNVQLSREIISDNTSMSVRNVTRCIATLEKFKFIKVIRYQNYENMNAPNIYSLTTRFWSLIDGLNFSEKTKFKIDKAMKATGLGRDKLSNINKEYGYPQNPCVNLSQISADNFKASLNLPIPDF